MNTYLGELNMLFREVMENDEIEINYDTVASDIDEWDSINHIYLIVEIEKHFKIKFTTSQILEWKNVGEMVEAIKEKKE